MAVKTIITNNHPTLRVASLPVSDKKDLAGLVTDLIDTLDAAGDIGIGLSANQIDTTLRIFVARIYKDGTSTTQEHPAPTVFINPEIVTASELTTLQDDPERTMLEGCLSLPNVYAFVERAHQVTVRFHTLETFEQDTEPLVMDFKKDNAVVVQHEIDHLDGILFTDRALHQGQKIYEIKEGTEPRILEI